MRRPLVGGRTQWRPLMEYQYNVAPSDVVAEQCGALWRRWQDSVAPSSGIVGQCGALWRRRQDSVAPSGGNGRTMWHPPVEGQTGAIWWDGRTMWRSLVEWGDNVAPSGGGGRTMWRPLVG